MQSNFHPRRHPTILYDFSAECFFSVIWLQTHTWIHFSICVPSHCVKFLLLLFTLGIRIHFEAYIALHMLSSEYVLFLFFYLFFFLLFYCRKTGIQCSCLDCVIFWNHNIYQCVIFYIFQAFFIWLYRFVWHMQYGVLMLWIAWKLKYSTAKSHKGIKHTVTKYSGG